MTIPSEITTIIVDAVVSIIAIIIGRYLIPFIKSKIGEQRANTLVKAAEQMYKAYDGPQKLVIVTEKLSAYLESVGINYTDEQIRDLIESAVKQMKIEANE